MEMAEAVAAKKATSLPPGVRRQRPAPNGQALPVGRPKGTPNKLTVTLKAAVERAARDCHPQGLAGWLVDRANGSIGDRQIFAALVGKVIPIQVNQSVDGGIRLELGWLGGRQIGASVAQTAGAAPQALDLQRKADGTYQIVDQHPHAEPAQASAQKAVGDAESLGK